MSLDGLQDASTQTQSFATDLKSVGTAAADAGAQATPALSEMDAASQKLQIALDKLAATEGPRGMIKNAALAQVALQDYTKAATTAGVSTTDMAAKVDAAGKQISAAADKVGIFKKSQADLTAAGAMTGSQLDKLRTSAGSLTGMFDNMERTGTGLEKTVGKIGLGFGIAGMAFMGAEAAGKALSKVLLEGEAAYSAYRDKQKVVIDTSALLNNALREVAVGHIKVGSSIAETVSNYHIWQAENSKSTGLLKELEAQLLKITPATNMQEAISNEVKFGEALSVAFNKGKVEASLFLESHKKMVDEYIATQHHMGQMGMQEWEDITKAMKEAEGAQKLLTEEGAKSAILSVAQIIDARKKADDAATLSESAAQAHFDAAMKRLNQETLSGEQYSAKKKALYEDMANAEQIAADKQAVADAEAVLAQAKLQESLKLSDGVMKEAVKATTDYEAAISAGVTPSTALKDAVALLKVSIQDTGKAIPDLDEAIKKIAEQGFKVAADQMSEAAKQAVELEKKMKLLQDRASVFGTVWDEMITKRFPTTGTGLDKMGAGFTELMTVLGQLGGILPQTGGQLKIVGEGFKDIATGAKELAGMF